MVAGEGETLVTGDAVNVAARLEQAAPPGEILIGAATLSLVRDAVTVEPVEPLQLKGKSEPVPAYRLVGVDVSADAFARQLGAPLVGGRVSSGACARCSRTSLSERVCQHVHAARAGGRRKVAIDGGVSRRRGRERRCPP